MKRKKKASVFLAALLCLASAFPAYAAGTEETSAASEAASSVSIEEIQEEASVIFENIKSVPPSTYSLSEDDIFYTQLEMLVYINMLRAECGLEPLVLLDEVSAAAMLRAQECQQLFDHTRPNGTDCFTVLEEMGIPYAICGENIAAGQSDVLEVMQAWWNSPGHQANILGVSFQAVGVGIDDANGYPTWVQLFTGGYDVSSVEVYNLSDTYQVGDSLQEQGILLFVTYSNGMTGYMPLLDSMVTGYNPNVEGAQDITITCQGRYGTFTIYVTDPIKAFVSRLYTEILGREPEADGLAAWSNVLRSGQEQGAKVAQGFIDSQEFRNRHVSDREYLTILYRTFFDREPDSAGLNAWLRVLDDGLSRLHVFRGFAESDEFTKICGVYGIERGNVSLTAPRDQNEGVTKFLVRCYRLCLGREADEDGLNAWCTQILTGANTAKQAAYGFVFSQELRAKNLSDSEYVKMLYRVFMDREADSDGLNAWIRVLQNGQGREHVFNGFADSREFQIICQKYGI